MEVLLLIALMGGIHALFFLLVVVFYPLVLLYSAFRHYIKNFRVRRVIDVVVALPVLPVLVYSIVFFITSFASDVSAERRNHAIAILLYMALLFIVNFVYLHRNKKIEKNANSTSKIIKAVRAEIHRHWITDLIAMFFSLGRGPHRSHYCLRSTYERDLYDILDLDAYLHEGENVEIPKMRTEVGETYLKTYLRLYAEEHPLDKLTTENNALQNNHWLCTFGRGNPSYTSTCVCGENK